METEPDAPTPEAAAAALADAAGARTILADGVVTPPFFFTALGAAIAVQIATTAIGIAGTGPAARWGLAAGLLTFVVTAAVELARFRQANGIWLGGLASRVVGGTATNASTAYVLALGACVWAALADAGWLVAPGAVAGGLAYALSGRRWLRTYRTDPVAHGRGEPAARLVVLGVLAVAGLALLVLGR